MSTENDDIYMLGLKKSDDEYIHKHKKKNQLKVEAAKFISELCMLVWRDIYLLWRTV